MSKRGMWQKRRPVFEHRTTALVTQRMTTYQPTTQNGCERCGCSTPRSRLCVACADADRGEHTTGGTGADDWYQCTECDRTFIPSHGTDPCPDCGSYRHVRVDAPEVADA